MYTSFPTMIYMLSDQKIVPGALKDIQATLAEWGWVCQPPKNPFNEKTHLTTGIHINIV